MTETQLREMAQFFRSESEISKWWLAIGETKTDAARDFKSVIPAKAGTHFDSRLLLCSLPTSNKRNSKMGSGFRRNDGEVTAGVSAFDGMTNS